MLNKILPLIVLSILLAQDFNPQSHRAELKFKKGSDEYYETGVLQKCKLSEEQEIHGLRLQNWIRFYTNASIKTAELAKDTEVFKHMFIPKGSTLFYTELGFLDKIWLGKDCKLDAYPAKGGGKITASFHTNGKIKTMFLDEDTEINGIPAQSSIFHSVKFHNNGNLKSCKLARKTTYRNKEYKKGHTIELDDDGNILSAERIWFFQL